LSAAGADIYLLLGLAALGLALIWLTGRGGYLGKPGSVSATWEPRSILLAVLSVGAAVLYFGVGGGIAIIFAVLWHEWGHVIAYRVAGHTDARFRLIPFFGGVAISNQRPKNEVASCFVTMMGPGFSLALVVLLFLGASYMYLRGVPYAYEVHKAAVLTGALNAFNMLPLWPLDGGRALRSITRTVAPGLVRGLTMTMCAALGLFALVRQMWILLFFAIMGLGYAKNANLAEVRLAPMTRRQALLAGAGYVCILAAHLLAGLPVILRIFRF
jgi:Zn-dependent protease